MYIIAYAGRKSLQEKTKEKWENQAYCFTGLSYDIDRVIYSFVLNNQKI